MMSTLMVQRMISGLSVEGREELFDILEEVSNSGRGDLVAVFTSVLNGVNLADALNLPRDMVKVMYSQAYAAFNAGNTVDALRLFQALAILDPSQKDHWLGLAVCLRIDGNYSAASLALATALELDKTCPATLFHLAELAFVDGRIEDSAKVLRGFDQLEASELKRRMAPEVHRLAVLIEDRLK